MPKTKHPKNRLIKLNINKNEYITIKIPNKSTEDINGYEIATGIYHTNDHRKLSILSRVFDIEIEISKLIAHLKHVLNNELEINLKILPNIGLEWNTWLYTLKKARDPWEGKPYLCFSGRDGETFIYTIDGTIYLEIVPTYPWLFGDKPKGMRKIPFKKFLKNYKPCIRTTITRETAEEWLAIAESLRNIIKQNQHMNKEVME